MATEEPKLPTPQEAKTLVYDYLMTQFAGDKKKNGIVLLALSSLGIVASALGLFVVLVPVTYLVGGQVLYAEHGWKPFQPGVGGTRFVALNGLAWALYATTIVMNVTNFFLSDLLLTFAGFGVGMISYCLMVSSLLTYKNDAATNARPQITAPTEEKLKLESKTFNEDLLASELLRNGERPTELWWLFIAMNTIACVVAAWIAVAADLHAKYQVLRIIATFASLSLLATSSAITHALGGQWRHLDGGFVAFQPGKGGSKFVAMQAGGWATFSLGELIGLIALAGQFQILMGGKATVGGPLLSIAGIFGLVGQIVIAASLFFFEAAPQVEDAPFKAPPKNAVMDLLKKTQFLGLNIAFAGGSTYEKGREPKLSGPDDWEQGEQKFMKFMETSCQKTGDQYLIIGVGFVGRRLVKRLLDRGETRIRLFDIIPSNPFAGDDRIEYVRGDVTKYEDVEKACQGVDTCYSTFAIIRFMDRLEHQAALSYRINWAGLKTF